MKYRKLRIAFSASCVIVAVLLCVLWVRSYWQIDHLEGKLLGRKVGAISAQGKLRLDLFAAHYRPRWGWSSEVIDGGGTVGLNPAEGRAIFETGYIHFSVSPGRIFLWSYDWIPILAMAILAGVSWIPLRFSLRTLLIATTLIAMVMGLVVWATR